MSSSRIVIITAPSGSGKTTLVKALLKRLPELSFSVSACTRAPRENEQDGKDYYFLSVADFKNKIAQNEFLEWQMVYPGKYYGTLNSEITRIWNNGQFPLVDIDVQGALRVKNRFAGESLAVFIKAPSVEELQRRLKKRGTDNIASIKERLAKAADETAFATHFDCILINDDLEEAQEKLFRIVHHFIQSETFSE